MRRFFKLILVGIMSGVMLISTGCSNSIQTNNSDGTNTQGHKTHAEKVQADNIKIEEIDWKVEEGIVRDHRSQLFSYTNNSKYVITNFIVNFVENDTITDEDVQSVHDYIINTLGCTEEDLKLSIPEKYGVQAIADRLVAPGESINNCNVYYYKGIVYVRDSRHMEIVEPDIAIIEYICDGKIYREYYDFKSGKYTLDSSVQNADQWPNFAIAELIPKPDALVISDMMSREGYLSCDVLGIKTEEYLTYVQKCKEQGFTEDVMDHESFYDADNADGYSLSINYDDDRERMTITLSAPR